MNFFNNREIAIAIWLLVIFIFILVIKNIRKSFLSKSFIRSINDAINILFKRKILFPIFLMITYTAGIVVGLYLLRFWKTSLLKDSIVWFCSTGILMGFKWVTSREDKNLFRKIIINNIRIVMIIEFVVNTYTFSLVGELVFIPFVTIIVALEIVARTNKKQSSVAKLMQGLQFVIGIFILIYAISNAVSDYKNFGSLDTLRSFLLAPLLAISISPFIYFLVLFTKYELLFLRLDLGCEKSKKLKSDAKRKIILYCRLSLKKVNKALNMNTYNLMLIRNKEDVNEMIKAYKGQA